MVPGGWRVTDWSLNPQTAKGRPRKAGGRRQPGTRSVSGPLGAYWRFSEAASAFSLLPGMQRWVTGPGWAYPAYLDFFSSPNPPVEKCRKVEGRQTVVTTGPSSPEPTQNRGWVARVFSGSFVLRSAGQRVLPRQPSVQLHLKSLCVGQRGLPGAKEKWASDSQVQSQPGTWGPSWGTERLEIWGLWVRRRGCVSAVRSHPAWGLERKPTE